MSIVITSSLDSIVSASISSGGPSNFIYNSPTVTLTDKAINPIIIQD